MMVELKTQIYRNPILELVDIRDNLLTQADYADIVNVLQMRAFDKCIILPCAQNIKIETFKSLRGELKAPKGAKGGKKRKRGK